MHAVRNDDQLAHLPAHSTQFILKMEIWNGRLRRSEVDRRSFGSRADSKQTARKSEGRAGGGRGKNLF
jgi:hypothetical protein